MSDKKSEPQDKYCGGKRRQAEGTCTRPAGWGTSHPGQGKCKLHGGATPIKHGLYSKIHRKSLRDELERIATEGFDPLDLIAEVKLLKALIADHLANTKIPSIKFVVQLSREIGALVDRIQKHKQARSVSLLTVNRVIEQMGVEVAAALQEIKLDREMSDRLCEVIERRWGSIKLDAYTSSGPINSSNADAPVTSA